ncbi:MAG: xanthine dehydrogenase family protein subunit M [bacterium]|nr:xanthine dehydrogenase family protein subunit M [bacterium]
MKPAPFVYFSPDSLEEALSLLTEYGESAKVLAGGQSLLPLMAFRLVRPSVLIDLRNIADLCRYRFADDRLTIGAMVTHRTIEFDHRLTGRCDVLAEALAVVGHVAIRNVGTVGGSLAHADPTAEWLAVALALGGQMTVTGPGGARRVAADNFCAGWMTSCLSPDEILTELQLEMPGPRTGSAFEEVARRHGDFAVVGVAATVEIAEETITGARIALAGAASTPIRARLAEALLVGGALSSSDLEEAGEAAAAEADPVADLHGSEDYKRHLARVLTRRAVARAYRRAEAQA